MYASRYGTTKKYAMELSKRMCIDMISYNDVSKLDNYDRIIYLGAIYAGGVLGLSKTFKKMSNLDNKRLVVVTVGLADPHDKDNIESIDNGIKKQVSQAIFEKMSIYHLRGGIDYTRLNICLKLLMKLLYNRTKNMPVYKQTSVIRTMIETYNSVVDFVDFNELNVIISEIN